MFKLGGITWWRNNYGSILQAYALSQYISTHREIEYSIVSQYDKKISSKANFLSKIKKDGVLKAVKKAFWKIGLPGLKKRTDALQAFIDEKLPVSADSFSEDSFADCNESYDGFIFGSDQIWNLKLVPLTSIYWGDFVKEGKKLIAYAPSLGTGHFEDGDMENIRKRLMRFSAVSSREESGARAINECLREDVCKTVLDPTLLVEKTTWDRLSSARLVDGDYLFAYMLRGTTAERKYIEKIAKKLELKIVTIPFLDSEKICMYDLRFGTIKKWDVSPSDFVSLIRHAKFVVTDSFHCMVFSVIYHVDFATFPKLGKAQLDRMTTLQKDLKIGDRMISADLCNFDDVFSKTIDWKLVDGEILSRRESSKRFLDHALDSLEEKD